MRFWRNYNKYMNIYIDESGNLGKRGEYFVITALVVNKNSAGNNRLKNIVKNFLRKSSVLEIKGSELSFESRQKIVNKLCKKKDHSFFYICLNKKNLQNKNLFREQSILFNFLSKFLFKEILKKFSPHKKTLHIYVDQRNVKHSSTHSLKDYVKTIILGDLSLSTEVYLDYFDSKNIKLIQLADLASGIIHNHYEKGKTHDYKRLKIDGAINFPKKELE